MFLLILCAVQFINVLDFMMVMPLGPDFARELHIPTSQLGWIGGSYTFSACLAGIYASSFLDRFDRKQALNVAVFGIALATLLGGFAVDFRTLLLTRVLAGAFGGPAVSLSFSMVADHFGAEKRGRAMGALMSAFSIASVFGVPVGLEVARVWGWQAPFFVLAGVAFVINLAAMFLIPPMVSHLKDWKPVPFFATTFEMVRRPECLYSFGAMAVSMLAAFSMIPNFSAYFQLNLGFPRERLGLLYLIGGSLSFLTLHVCGRLVDRYSSSAVVLVGTSLLALDILLGYAIFPPVLPPIVVFVAFMCAMSIRGVAISTVSSRVPLPHERARFMSLISAVQHGSSSLGAFTGSILLSTGPTGALVGMPILATFSIACCLLIPIFVLPLERSVRGRESEPILRAEGQSLGA